MKTSFTKQLSAALVFASALSLHAQAEPEHPNVLLICIDDLRPELKCYGAEHMITPNMDKLSETGVTFDHCYVQVAVCNPSRASTWTGLRPDKLGVWTLPVHFREATPDAITLPQHLRKNGYICEGYGKIFHNEWPDPRSWDRPHRWGPADYKNYTPEQKAFTRKVAETFPEASWQHRSLRGPITNAPDIPDAEHSDGALALLAIDRLKALTKSKKPFFLAVGFTLPHLQWAPPKSWWEKYDRDTIPLPSNPYPPKGAPEVATGTNYELSHYADMIHMPTPESGSLSEAETRRLRHGYFASTSFIDAQVGLLLYTLNQQKLTQTTIVILWSDHGYKLGEHNGWSKMTNYEIDTRIPFIIRDPRAKANGKRCGQIVESLDVFPTICELTGVPVPDFVDGKSAAPLLNDPNLPHIDAAYSQYIWGPLIGNAIRTERWRYVEWRKMEDGSVQYRELYDQENDPDENVNVAENQAEVVSGLAQRLSKVLVPGPKTTQPIIFSREGGKKIKINWPNQYNGALDITWVKSNGCRAQAQRIGPGKSFSTDSKEGYVYSVESIDGRYHEAITLTTSNSDYKLGHTRE